MSKFDKRIEQELSEHTEKDARALEEDIWKGINEELFERRTFEMKKRPKRWMPAVAVIAAALVLAFTLQTESGSAIMKSVKDMFAPEKEIIQSLEGQDEHTNVTLNEGKDSEYVIYVDESRYKMVKGEEVDIITTSEPLPDDFPEVSMEIRQYPDELPDDLVKKIEAELKVEFPDLRPVETVTEPVEGYWLHGLAESVWDGKVIDVYVVSNGKEGSFVITENYFLEAAEGHGARFTHMLESFEVVD